MIGGRDDRIIKCGTSAGINLFQRLFQLEKIIGEILIEIIFVVKVHHENFVLRIAGTHQIERGLIHFAALLLHRPRIIDEDAHRDRNVFLVKRNNVLRLAVFKHGKCAAVERSDDMLPVIDYRGVQKNFVDVFAKDEDALIVQVVVLIFVLIFLLTGLVFIFICALIRLLVWIFGLFWRLR